MGRISWPFVTPREIIDSNRLMREINSSPEHQARLVREAQKAANRRLTNHAGYFPPQPKKTFLKKVMNAVSNKLYKAKETAKAFWWG